MDEQSTWFDEEHYLKSKLAQLHETEPTAGWTMQSLRDAIANAGLTPFSHFQAYGLQERTSPNPSFNAHEYLEAKLRQLQKEEPGKYNSIDEVADAIRDAGLGLWDHFNQYGWKEGVNPSNNFDINGYFEKKLAELQKNDADGNWDIDKVKQAFEDAGLDPVSHYAAYGKDEEGVEPVEVPEEDRVPDDPRPPVDPEPEPGPEPEPEPEPDPGPVPPTLFQLKTLTANDLEIVNGTNGNDIFSGDSSNTVRGGELVDGVPQKGLVLDGKGGADILRATLSESVHHPNYAPTIKNVQTISLTARNQEGETKDDIGLMFSRVSGMEILQNTGSTANLTATDVRNKVMLSIDNMTVGNARDFAVRYGENVNLDNSQVLYLRDAHINLLTVTKLDWDGKGYQSKSAGITDLDIYAYGLTSTAGSNSIASFDEELGAASLAATLRDIDVHGAGSLSLNLAELKALAKRDDAEGAWERIHTDLSDFNIGTGDLVRIKVADLANGESGNKTDLGDGTTQANSKSNQTIELGKDLDAGSRMIIENMTIASTKGYTHDPVHNDVLVLTDWAIADANALANLITTFTVSTGAKLSDSLNYVNFEIGFDVDGGDPETGFTLTLKNLVSENVYNKMLQAVDTVNSAGNTLTNTKELVGFTGGWVVNGTLHEEFNTGKFTDGSISLDTDAIIGLTGVLVNEGAFILNEGTSVLG